MNDVASIDCRFVETGLGDAPHGTCGIGESGGAVDHCIMPSALYNAIGKYVDSEPVTPDKFLEALGKVKRLGQNEDRRIMRLCSCQNNKMQRGYFRVQRICKRALQSHPPVGLGLNRAGLETRPHLIRVFVITATYAGGLQR
jgi:hypothetical protein